MPKIRKRENRMKNEIKKIAAEHNNDSGNLISILQDIQASEGCLSKEAVSEVAEALYISQSEIYGVATFYTQFRFTKPANHQVKVCLGTACHVRGGHGIMETVERQLYIKHGEKTKDSQFSLERVACMGCCALAPVMVVDKDIYGKVTLTKAGSILNKYREKMEGKL